jgi:hypothetical protein
MTAKASVLVFEAGDLESCTAMVRQFSVITGQQIPSELLCRRMISNHWGRVFGVSWTGILTPSVL